MMASSVSTCMTCVRNSRQFVSIPKAVASGDWYCHTCGLKQPEPATTKWSSSRIGTPLRVVPHSSQTAQGGAAPLNLLRNHWILEHIRPATAATQHGALPGQRLLCRGCTSVLSVSGAVAQHSGLPGRKAGCINVSHHLIRAAVRPEHLKAGVRVRRGCCCCCRDMREMSTSHSVLLLIRCGVRGRGRGGADGGGGRACLDA